EIDHAREDPVGPRTGQYSLPVAAAIMAAADKSPDGHAGRLARLHAAGTVLDHEGARRIGSHLLGGVEKKVWRRLAALDHLRGIEPVAEKWRETGDVQRQCDPVEIARRGHAI